MPPTPLAVRLRNFVGDVVLSVPTLQRLSDAGFALHLVGKGWARPLLEGFGWPVQALAPGDAVGYGSGFVASSAMRIGVVAAGYADGYPRHAPTGTPVAVGGVRTRVVGRVSMDMLTIDLTGAPAARPGDPVELWGEQVPVDEVAAPAGTIGYELLCAIAPRVSRLIED